VIAMGYGYAFQGYDGTRHVRAAMRERQISHKHAREIAASIRRLTLEGARDYLQAVIRRERAVPMRRHKRQVGHKSDPGVMAGRYPVKAAEEFVRLLDNLESNAEYKGMDLDRLRLVGVTVHKGMVMERFTPRAFGRASPKNNTLTHVELVAQEV